MGIMYKIRKVNGEPVFDNWNKIMNHDIVELEEIKSHHEELGLVRIEDVLKIIERFMLVKHSELYKEIEGMKGK